MMELTKYPTVGSFVASDYRTASVFQKYGIDFCCKGGKTIDEVCEKKNIDPDRLLNELSEVSASAGNSATGFRYWPLDRLADYIEKKHHRYIGETTPVIQQFLDKLCKVHGQRHPELFQVNEEFNKAAGELAMHMKKEELILFPLIRKLVAFRDNDSQIAQLPFDTVKNPIQVMMMEHDVEGDRFRRIAELTGDYQVPADGCTTYRVAFSMLKDFEADLHMHIHLENNILFPRAIEVENN